MSRPTKPEDLHDVGGDADSDDGDSTEPSTLRSDDLYDELVRLGLLAAPALEPTIVPPAQSHARELLTGKPLDDHEEEDDVIPVIRLPADLRRR